MERSCSSSSTEEDSPSVVFGGRWGKDFTRTTEGVSGSYFTSPWRVFMVLCHKKVWTLLPVFLAEEETLHQIFISGSPQQVHSLQDAWEHGLLSAWGFLSGRQLRWPQTLSGSICFHTVLHRWCCCRVQTYTQLLDVLVQGQGSHSQAKQSIASFIAVYKSKGCVYGGQKRLAQDLRYSSKGQEPAAMGSNLHPGPQLHVKCNSNH